VITVVGAPATGVTAVMKAAVACMMFLAASRTASFGAFVEVGTIVVAGCRAGAGVASSGCVSP
jgi:hypothetical protein